MNILPHSANTRVAAPPPVASLDSPRHTSPLMILSSGNRRGRAGGRDCLALMWPGSDEDDSKHSLSPVSPAIRTHLGGTVTRTCQHDSMTLDSPHGNESLSLDRTVEVLACPSGRTVVRMRTSFEAILPSPAKRSSHAFRQLSLPYSPNPSQKDGTQHDRHSFPGNGSMWPKSFSDDGASMNFSGHNLASAYADKSYSGGFSPKPASSHTGNASRAGDTSGIQLPSLLLKKKGARRRKGPEKDKIGKGKPIGGARGILEQDHPEEDVTSHNRCPCFRFFLLVCVLAVCLALLFSLSLWLVAKHRSSPIILGAGESLEEVLQRRVFGQPIVLLLLPDLFAAFLPQDSKDRTMVLMFHGQPGVGKTFVADLVGQTLFPDSTRQHCLHTFLPSLMEVKDHLVTTYDYSIALEDFIDGGRANYRTCPVVLYVVEDIGFDSPQSLFDALAFTLSSVRKRQASKEQKMVFILITNIGGANLGQYMLQQLRNGRSREDFTPKELAPVPAVAPDAEEATIAHDDIKLKANYSRLLAVIDNHIPFLPLEREHVLLCVKQTLDIQNARISVEDMEWIADKLFYYPENGQVFSSSGCKKVEEKANLFSNYIHS